MDCPGCGAFNSMLDKECDECGMTLAHAPEPPQKVAYRRSFAPPVPDKPTRSKLRVWVSDALRAGATPAEIAQAIEKQGYDAEWTERFVERVEWRPVPPLKPRRPPDREGSLAIGFFIGAMCGPLVVVLLLRRSAPRTIKGALYGFSIALVLALLRLALG